jgi:predicted kinase
LPFEPSPTEAQIRWTAWRAGYDMPVEEALRISERLANATPEEAQTIMRDLQMSPRQVADAPARIDPPAKEAPREVTPIEDPHAPEFQAAVRADLDREVAAPPVAGSREEFGQMLARGAPLDELMEHPEVQRALEENKGRAITGTTEDFANPEWRANRVYQFTRPDGTVDEIKGWDAAVNHLADQARGFAGGELRNQRQATILLGKPAAGKSTISEHIARERGAAIVDADEAKKIIPEYENGLGSLAVHDESAELSKEVLKRLVDEGSNIIIPKIGSRVEQIRNYMGMLKYFGYKVDVGVVHIPTELAQRRNLERLFRTGRLVDPEYIRQVGDSPQETAHILRGEANDYASIDTHQNTVEGTGPLADLVRARGYNVGGPSEGVERAQAGVARQGEIAAGPISSAARAGPITAAEVGEAGRFPAAVDTAGNVTYQNIDRALSEVDAYKTAAEQIAACAGPAPAPQAEAA